MQTPYILAYNKTIANEMNATASREFYSVYDHNNTLAIHTSDKTLALDTLRDLLAVGPAVTVQNDSKNSIV